MNKIIFSAAAIISVGQAIRLRQEEEEHESPCEQLWGVDSKEALEAAFKHASEVVEAEAEHLKDAGVEFDWNKAEEAVGVKFDIDEIHEAVAAGGAIDAGKLVEGCYKLEDHINDLWAKVEVDVAPESKCFELYNATEENWDEYAAAATEIIEGKIEEAGDKFD
jgi:hypothetical protein